MTHYYCIADRLYIRYYTHCTVVNTRLAHAHIRQVCVCVWHGS
jgi:hypothetical protein